MIQTQRARELNERAEALVSGKTTGELFQLLELASSDSRKAEAYRVITWVRGALIDRNICPDCRGELDEEVRCTGCPF